MIIIILILTFLSILIFSYNFFSIEKKISIKSIDTENKSSILIKSKDTNYIKYISDILVDNLSNAVSKSNIIYIKNWLKWADSKLFSANYPQNLTPDKFVANHIISISLISFLGLTVMWILFETFNIFYFVLFTGIGVFYPVFWINSKISQRHRNIIRTMPDILDILTLSVESGLDFNTSISRIISEDKNEFIDELYKMQQEVGLGKTRESAMRDMAKRINLPGVTTVVSSLTQALQLGTSLSQTLRSLSTQMRTERFQLAEKLAHEAPIKMLAPLLLFILPAVFLILFGPIVLSFLQAGF